MKIKRIWLILVLLFSVETVMAQGEMTVSLTRATAAPFPTSAMAYYNNPMNYFNLTITPVDGRAHDVFISMELSSDATTTRIWTDDRFVGMMPKINIPAMGKRIGSTEFVQHFYRRLNTNLSESYRGVSDLTLPEGTYHLCIEVHDYSDTSLVLGKNCMDFDICYSGLAPELTSPHLTPSSGPYDKLVPSKKTNFAWTGVVSNCFEPNAFEYVIQFVEVYPGQNVQEAVEKNPVLTALDCGRRTFFTFDYQTNPYLKLDSGGVYAVMVEAVPADPDRVVSLSNDGKSQYMVFMWSGPNTSGIGGTNHSASSGGGGGSTTGNGDGVTDTKMTMKDNQAAVLRTLRKPQIMLPRPLATVDANDALRVLATPVRGDSVSSADYEISLYEYVGDMDVSMSRPPMKQTQILNVTAHDENPIEMVNDWSADLVGGTQYLVSLKADVTYRYNNTYHIRRVDFIDRFPEINRYDSVVGMVGHTEMAAATIFKWGEGADEYNVLTAPEILNLGKGTASGSMLKLKRTDLKELVWKESKFDGSHSDLVVYDIYVYDMGNEATPVYEKTGVDKTVAHIRDLQEKVFAGHTYKVIVRARMHYDEVGSENGVDSKEVQFEIKSSNESSYNTEEVFRLKGGMLFDDDEPVYVMSGRTAVAPVMVDLKSEPDSAVKSFKVGNGANSSKVSIYRGFKSDRLVNASKGKDSKGEKYQLSAQLDMFTLEGEVSQLPSGGWGGPVKVTVMDGVSATMNVAFGTSKDSKGENYDWWYMYGSEQHSQPQKAGALRCGGFGGVFAHNMSIDNSAYLNKSAKELVDGNYAGVKFTPQRGSWVAKGGIQMALENKELLDAYGIVALASENGHFSRLFVDMGKEKLSADNRLMEPGCQKVFFYELTGDGHLLHLVQLPQGVENTFAYNGILHDGEVANVGLNTKKVASQKTAGNMQVVMDIETWHNGGDAQYCVRIKGAQDKELEMGDGKVSNLTITEGKRKEVDQYNMDKDLQSALPSSAKSKAMQASPKTAVRYNVKDDSKNHGLKMSDVEVQSSMSKNDEKALVNGGLGTSVDFEGWHGNAVLTQSVAPAEVAVDDNYALKGVEVKSDMQVNAKEEDGQFEFFKDVDFTAVDEKSGKVSPFSQSTFSTEIPVTHENKGKKRAINDVMVAAEGTDGKVEARRFCVAMDNGNGDVKYSYGENGETVMAENNGGGFNSGEVNDLTLKATMYEKRRGTNSADDRVVDVFTGKEDVAMKDNSLNWGRPKVGGQAQSVMAEKTLSFVTEEAPCTLANQVLFTWPYNGDPFVPCDELDSACYIFMKQNRDDIFRPEKLSKEGKVLRVFLVNQEMGHVQAASCRYEYFSVDKSDADAMPYVKVYMPKSVYKVKNASKTYSPCVVSMMVVDTVAYGKAYQEFNRKAVYSGEKVSQYAVCRESGTPVYDLYFRLDHMYATYKALMDTISAESARNGQGIGFGADKVTVDPSNGVISSQLSTINLNRYYAFRNRSYLFDSYKPNNANMYAAGVVLPPIAVFAVNGRQTIDDFYNTHIPEWMAVHESFYYQYSHLLYFQQRAKWVVLENRPVLYDPTVRVNDLSMLAPASMRVSKQKDGGFTSMTEKELGDVFVTGNSIDRGNLTPIRSTYWFHEGTQMRDAYDWHLPALMKVNSDQVQRVGAVHFSTNNHIKSSAFVKEKPVISIEDVVSPAIMKENKVFASFFAQIRSYAEWFANLDAKDRREVRESLYTLDIRRDSLPQVKTLYLTMDAPFSLPKASLVTAYDSWANTFSQFKSRDYWFDNWIRTNTVASYPGVKPAWASPWLASSFSPNNTMQYKQASRRTEYRNYIVNPYYLTVKGNEKSFINTVFGICHEMQNGEHPMLHHNATSDVRISIHVPYNKAVKNYISPDMQFVKP